jgi:hypothetical protein
MADFDGLGENQKALLRWLADQPEGEASYYQTWCWYMELSQPDYPNMTELKQARLRPLMNRSMWGLLRTLVKRGLILVIPSPDGKQIDMVCLQVDRADVLAAVE